MSVCLPWPEVGSPVEVAVVCSGVFRQPLARVWNALTSDEELGVWFDTDTRLYLEPGGELIAPGATQFRGAFVRATAREITPGRHILWDWPLREVSTQVTWLLTEEFGGTRFEVRHVTPRDAPPLFPESRTAEALAQFWMGNMVCLKVWLDLGFPPERSRFGERPKAGLDVSLNVPVSLERVWSLVSEASSWPSWCPWPCPHIETLEPGRSLLVPALSAGVASPEDRVILRLEGGPRARDCLVRVESRARASGAPPVSPDSHERWLTALHAFAVFAVTGESFPTWCAIAP